LTSQVAVYHRIMPDRSRKRPPDLNALAASIVNDATNEDKTEPADDGRTRLPSRWGGAVG